MIEILKTMKRHWQNLIIFFFKVLYHWTATLDFNLLSFHDFLDLFSLSS
jgi:hypothetical protein